MLNAMVESKLQKLMRHLEAVSREGPGLVAALHLPDVFFAFEATP